MKDDPGQAIVPFGAGVKRGVWWVVTPRRDTIGYETADEFRQEVLSAVDRGERRIAVDLTAVRLLDSMGLGAFVAILKKLDTTGRLRLFGAAPTVLAALSVLKMETVLPHFASEREALETPE